MFKFTKKTFSATEQRDSDAAKYEKTLFIRSRIHGPAVLIVSSVTGSHKKRAKRVKWRDGFVAIKVTTLIL